MGLAFWAITAWQTRNLLDKKEPLPQLQLYSLEGERLNLDELQAKQTVVYVWATWCGVCTMQSRTIQKLHDSAGDDLSVISVVLAYSSPEAVKQHVEDNDIRYPVYLGDETFSRALQVNSFPTIYIVDDQSRVRHGLVGYTTNFGLKTRLLL